MDFFDLLYHLGKDYHDKFFCNDDSIDEEDQKDDSDFFYPNACQTCGIMKRLLRCSKCRMVSYCGKKHQSEHWPFHKTWCKVLAEARDKSDFLEKAKGQKQEAWSGAKQALINHLEMKLAQSLTHYQKKVIKFTRACFICHEVDQQKLVNCPDCASVSFCHQHKDLRLKVHAENCPQWKLCYVLDLEKLQEKKRAKVEIEQAKRKAEREAEEAEKKAEEEKRESKKSHSQKSKNYHKKEEDENEKKKIEFYLDPLTKISQIKETSIKSIPYLKVRPDSMKGFLEVFTSQILHAGLTEKEVLDFSDLFIKPLSVYRSLKELNLVDEGDLVIHVVNAEVEDLDTYFSWETLFHWMPNLTSLKIVLFSEELVTQTLSPKLCDKCAEMDRKLAFELCSLDYLQFTKEKTFAKPSLLVGFKFQVKKEKDSVLNIAEFVAPFAFTNDTEKIAKENHKLIKKHFGKTADSYFFEKNPFSGMKPYLDIESDGVAYSQQFLTVYFNLRKTDQRNRKQNGGRKNKRGR